MDALWVLVYGNMGEKWGKGAKLPPPKPWHELFFTQEKRFPALLETINAVEEIYLLLNDRER